MSSTPNDLVASTATKYDDSEDNALRASTLRRLRWRLQRGGKDCTRCLETKPVSQFAVDARRPSGLAYSCRACEALRKREARQRKASTPRTPDE